MGIDVNLGGNSEWLASYMEKLDRDFLAEKLKTDSHHDWGDNLGVLIMCDRCPERANGLSEYLKEKTNLVNVSILKTLGEAKKYIMVYPVDILIFVGYQADEANYEIQKIIKEQNPNTYIVMYAFLDAYIKSHCVANGIQHVFSSEKPTADFISYLKETCSRHNFLILKDTYYKTSINERGCTKPETHVTFISGILNRVKSIF